MATILHDPSIFFCFYREVYKCKSIFSPPRDPYAFFYHPSKMLFPLRGKYEKPKNRSTFIVTKKESTKII